MLSLFVHIHVTLLMNYNSTQRVTQRGGHTVSVYTPRYSLYIERLWLIHHGDNVLTVCYKLLMNLTGGVKKKKACWARCTMQVAKILHTMTLDTFLFLYNV